MPAFRRKLARRKKQEKQLDRAHTGQISSMFPNDTAPGRHLPTSDTRRQKWDKIHSSILLSVAWKAARSWECTFEDEEEADGAEDVDNEEEDVDADDEDEDV